MSENEQDLNEVKWIVEINGDEYHVWGRTKDEAIEEAISLLSIEANLYEE